MLTDHFAIPAAALFRRASGATDFTVCRTNMSPVACSEIAPEIANGRVIVAHLGSGASMCAISNGRSIESTMGFTALDGLPMGTRPGQIDPGVVLYLLSEKGMNPQEAQVFSTTECGLKGLSGSEQRCARTSGERRSPGAALALDYFVHRVSLYAGMLAAALGGLDAFVFTAGIGERSVEMRSRIAEKLAWLGAELNPAGQCSGQADHQFRHAAASRF